jgi:hypothetical protein
MTSKGSISTHSSDQAASRRPPDGMGAGNLAPLQGDGDILASTDFQISSDSDDALHMELYRRFDSAMRSCKYFSLNEVAFAPTAPRIPALLAETLKDPENRSCAWRYFGTLGIDGAFSATERRALCIGLLSYVNQDRAECVIPLIEMALYASDHRDMPLYKAVGEVARAAGLGRELAAATVSGFCKLSSYNAITETAFHPWIAILAHSGSETVYAQIAETLAARVGNRQPGTYDHLLRTLCQSPSPHAASALRLMVTAPYPPIADEIPKPRSLKVGLWTGTQLCLATVAAQGFLHAATAFLRSEELGMAVKTALLSPQVWTVGASAGTLCGLTLVGWMWKERRKAIELFDAIRDFFKSSDYLHFAERVYAGLGESASRNPYATSLRVHMERSDVYASAVETWKRVYPAHYSYEGRRHAGAHGES